MIKSPYIIRFNASTIISVFSITIYHVISVSFSHSNTSWQQAIFISVLCVFPIFSISLTLEFVCPCSFVMGTC